MANDKKYQIRTAILRANAILDDSEIVMDITPGRSPRLYVGQAGVRVKNLRYFVASDSLLLGASVTEYFFLYSGSIKALYLLDGTYSGFPKYTKFGGNPVLDRVIYVGGEWRVQDAGVTVYSAPTAAAAFPTLVQSNTLKNLENGWQLGSGVYPPPMLTQDPATGNPPAGTLAEVLGMVAQMNLNTPMVIEANIGPDGTLGTFHNGFPMPFTTTKDATGEYSITADPTFSSPFLPGNQIAYVTASLISTGTPTNLTPEFLIGPESIKVYWTDPTNTKTDPPAGFQVSIRTYLA